MPNLTIGTVQTEFTADNRKFEVATVGVEQQLQAVGKQAEAAAVKVKSAGDVIDRTAAQQERAKERARRAWQQEMQAQDRAIAKEGELARARELAALRADIEARNAGALARKLAEEAEAAALAAEKTRRLGETGEFVKRGLELAGIGVGVEIVADKLKELVVSTVETGVELGHLSQQTGISVEDLSVLKFAARSTGIEFETLTKGFKKLSTEVYGADNGSRQAVKAFADLGISEADLKAKGNDLYGVLTMVADRFKAMPDGIQKNALATEIFGRAGQQLIPILNQGAEGIERIKAQAPIFTDKDVESVEKLHKAVVTLGTAWDNVGKSITTAIGPALTTYLNNFSAGITAIVEKQKSDWQRTREWFETLSRIRFGVEGGLVPKFYMAPPTPAAAGESGSAETAKPKPGTAGGAAGGAGGGASDTGAVTINLARLFDAQVEWQTKNREDLAAFYRGLDEKAAARWAETHAFQIPYESTQLLNQPGRAMPPPDIPDRWKELRENMVKTTDAFTNLQSQITSLVDQALRSFNATLVELATGRKANWSGMFRGLASSGVGFGLQQIEGQVFKGLMPPSSDTAGVPSARSGFWPAALRTIGGLLGLVKPGGGALGPTVAPVTPTSGFDWGNFDLPGRALGGPVLAGHAYMVGERGPEPFIPSSDGRIVPSGLGGGGAYYEIDARGASAAEVEQRVSRAIARAHGSAVQNAIAVQNERRRRVPSRNM